MVHISVAPQIATKNFLDNTTKLYLKSRSTSDCTTLTPNKQFLNYGYAEQLKDILPSMLLAIFMGACVWPLQYLNLPLIAVLAVQASAGAAIYFALSAALKFETFWMLWDVLLKIVNKARRKA